MGVLLSDTLSWWSHARRVRSCINSMVNILRRVGSCLNAGTRSKVFKAFVKLHMVYSATVWDIEAPTETAKMDTVQTHAVRVITRVPNVEPNTHTFQSLEIMLFRENVFYLNTVKVFNFLKDNMLNYYLCSPLIEETSQRVTRGSVRWTQVLFF